MEEYEEGLGQRGIPSGNLPAGVGFIIIPTGIDPELYKANCYKRNKVSIYGGQGYGNFHDVPVDTLVMQRIEFPEKTGKFGSPIVWINLPKHNDPIIVGILKYENEDSDARENNISLIKEINGNLVNLDMDAKKGKITISASCMNKGDASELEINLNSKGNDSKFKLKVNGDVFIISSGKIVTISNKTIETAVATIDGKVTARVVMNGDKDESKTRFLYEDIHKNSIIIKKESIQIKSDEAKVIKFGDGEEPMVKGTTLKKHLDSIVEEIGKLTVPTAFGPSGTPLNIAAFLSVKEQFDQFLSKLTNTD